MNDQDQERFNEDEEEGDDPELALPAIESLDDYVRRYGLLAANEGESIMKNRPCFFCDFYICFFRSPTLLS